ncbi:MAG: lipid-binding SYLF domain-containing protein [Deltaproteobacteria bacterium]|nr:lipid-binding SYLF domain-containing protein [Deltaproteobacteria bacterium]MCW5801650.1 lipid-binding SYLF domain-containing protein [Deltaproteobacteria bacterium]
MMILAAMMGGLTACATAPRTASEQQSLIEQAQATLAQMLAKDPSLHTIVNASVGYAVFPSIGKGGLVVGGAHGRGVLFERGQPVGYVSLTQASLGAQIGGQSFAELVLFRDQFALGQVKANRFELGANASAVALTAGAGASTRWTSGVAVFTMAHGGLMAELSVSGQRINFQPKAG